MSSVAQGRFDAATDPLRPFVPRIAVDWLRDTPAERAQCFEGTLVFADISGFTDLTEALAKRGREGAEEIAGVVDAAFAELIRQAYAHHADLLKFGGDAILLLFRGDGSRTARGRRCRRDAGGARRHAPAVDLRGARAAADVDRHPRRRRSTSSSSAGSTASWSSPAPT